MWAKLRDLLVGYAGHILTATKLAASFIVARIMAAFGLTWVTWAYALPDIKAFIAPYITGLDPRVQQLVGALGIDIFMIMILSAIAAQVGTRVFLASAAKLEELLGQAQS